jgi:hypothetical protein
VIALAALKGDDRRGFMDFSVHVIDEDGNNKPGVSVSVEIWEMHPIPGSDAFLTETTDDDGQAEFSFDTEQDDLIIKIYVGSNEPEEHTITGGEGFTVTD